MPGAVACVYEGQDLENAEWVHGMYCAGACVF